MKAEDRVTEISITLKSFSDRHAPSKKEATCHGWRDVRLKWTSNVAHMVLTIGLDWIVPYRGPK